MTARCNLRCKHCWSNSGPGRHQELRWGDLRDLLLDLSGYGLQRVSLSGGEPLLHDSLLQAVHELADVGFDVSISTNGTLHKRLTRLIDVCVNIGSMTDVAIRVSVDGPKTEHDRLRGNGTFDRAICGIKLVRERMGWVSVNVALGWDVQTGPGWTRWCTFLEMLADIGVKEVAVMPIAPRGRGAKYRVEAGYNCGGNICVPLEDLNITVVVWSYLPPCQPYLLIEHDGTIRLAHAREEDDHILGQVGQCSSKQILDGIRTSESEA